MYAFGFFMGHEAHECSSDLLKFIVMYVISRLLLAVVFEGNRLALEFLTNPFGPSICVFFSRDSGDC